MMMIIMMSSDYLSSNPSNPACGHKTGCNIQCISTGEKKLVRTTVGVRTAVSYQPVREAAVPTTCGIPSRINRNRIVPGACPWYKAHAHPKNQQKKNEKRKHEGKDKKTIHVDHLNLNKSHIRTDTYASRMQCKTGITR